MSDPISILIVDDHEVVRNGIRAYLSTLPDFQVVGEADSGEEAIKLVTELIPDVVLMDIRLPGEGGIEATRQVTARFPDSKVVMLTSFADDDLVVRAISAGAVGYVLKQVGNEELLRAIRAAARGEARRHNCELRGRGRTLPQLRPSKDACVNARKRQTEITGPQARGTF